MQSQWGGLVLYKSKLIILITIVIILEVWWRILPVIVIVTRCCGFTKLGVLMHGICHCGKVIQTAGTDEAQVVMHSPQMVYHSPFVLTFHPTPRAES